MKQINKPIKVLFLVGGEPKRGLAPSSRFRVYFYFARFVEDPRFEITISPSRPAKSFHERLFFKRRPRLSKLIIPLGMVLMILVRLRDLLRAPFFDVVFIQKELLPGRLYPFLELAITHLNRRVMFDFDDAIFVYHEEKSVDRENRLYKFLQDRDNIARILRHCDHVVVGNPFLAEYARQHNSQVSLVPTAIDSDYYRRPDTAPADKPRLVIGWIGTSGNLGYVEELAPVFRSLQSSISCELRIVCNPINRKLNLDGVDYHWIDWSPETELAELGMFNVGIMPLSDTVWERGKCGFKLLQYMAFGIPAVASPVGVNRDIISEGRNGFLASDVQEWEEKIGRLLFQPDLRSNISRAGRETILQDFSLDTTYPKLARAIVAAASS